MFCVNIIGTQIGLHSSKNLSLVECCMGVCFFNFAVGDIPVISVNVVHTVAQKDKKWFVLALLFLLGFFNNIFIFIFESFQPFLYIAYI